MQVKVYVLPGGKLQIFVDDVPFEVAAEETRTILARLRAETGLNIAQISDIEQHKDGVDHVHVTGQAHVQH